MRSASSRPTPAQQLLLDGLQLPLLAPDELPRCDELLQQHRYLGSLQTVGERLHYALTDATGDWLGVLIFCAAATAGLAGPRNNAAASEEVAHVG